MKFWVGVTDTRWFKFLAARNLDEVNFWQPSATPPFKTGAVGMPFLFKVKRPDHHIAGGGYFVGYSTMPMGLAWDVFGEKNGAASSAEFYDMVGKLAGGRSDDHAIGCTIITTPQFWPREDWLADPPGFASNIVVGKYYESAEPDGAAIWRHFQQRATTTDVLAIPSSDPAVTTASRTFDGPKYGAAVTVKPRIGQAAFRVLVMDAYQRRCAITGENTLIALEAAHIQPYAGEGTHDIRNGMLLRADFHRLFDKGLVSVTQDRQIKISPRIREAYFNGKAYYRLDGKPLEVVPESPDRQPDPDRLKWHYENVFQA